MKCRHEIGRTLMRRAFIILLAFLCPMGARAANGTACKMPSDLASALVLTSLSPKQSRLPSLGVDPYRDPNSARFLFFTVTWAGTPNGSVVVGNYAVDPCTGDVFSATSSCYEERNGKLESLQKKFRASIHLTKADYQKLKTKGPLCGE